MSFLWNQRLFLQTGRQIISTDVVKIALSFLDYNELCD